MIEVLVVVAIVGAMAAMSFPALSKQFANQRLKDSANILANAIDQARSDAIFTGNIHVVFYGTDALGAALVDAGGNTVPILVLNDGRPGSANQNCQIDVGEPIRTATLEDGVSPGITGATGNAPADLGSGDITSGSSFTDPGGADSSWMLFRPDGAAISFDSACAMGNLGSGTGAFYLTNSDRTAAVVTMPTGGTHTHSYQTVWSN